MIEHNLVRATVIPEIVRLICNYYKISEKEAKKLEFTDSPPSTLPDCL